MALPITSKQSVQQAKTKNIIDMALTFSATLRVFSKQSKATIAGRLEHQLANLNRAAEKEDYERVHSDFCDWFIRTIRTAAKTGKRPRPSGPSSYGQAAKIMDVTAKVYFHYCAQPSPEVAGQIISILHCALDTEILKHLAGMPDANIRSKSIGDIDRDEYGRLQAGVLRDIRENFRSEILPVEYDDIMWRHLSRERQA